MTVLLEARNLTVRRGARTVLAGVELTLEAGVCLGVIGANGSGKSSLLLALRGLLPSTGGLSLVGGDPRTLARGEVARRVAVVPQRFDFTFPYAVREMVLLGRAVRRRPWQPFSAEDHVVANAMIRRLGLEARADTPVDALSGGERRRVFLARALAMETPLIFLDEPTAGLDPPGQEELAAWIATVRAERRAAIVVSLHDMALAARLCDRVLGLAGGRQQFSGPTNAVLRPDSLKALFGIDWEVIERAGATPWILPVPPSASAPTGRLGAGAPEAP